MPLPSLSVISSSDHKMQGHSGLPLRCPSSLTGSDFYPLIDIRSKEMTYEEKVAYRTKHGIPCTIDKWIANAKTLTKAPSVDAHYRGPSLEYLLWEDNVECILNVLCKEGLFEGDTKNPNEFKLTLHVRVPPTTGFLMYYWHSPTVVIDLYMGDPKDKISPEWLESVKPERRFWQSRNLMLEMMLYFVRTIPQNSRVLTRVTSWCRAMSIHASGLSTSVRPRPYFNPILPRNTRSHKPRASDLSGKESQKMRKILNQGSPSRRMK